MSIRMSDIENDFQQKRRGHYGAQNVKFKLYQDFDPEASDKSGKIEYKNQREVIVVYSPDGGVSAPITVEESHKRNYPEQYAAFKAGLEQPIVGTPLAEWTIMPRTFADQLARNGILSVEQLADLPENAIQKTMGCRPFVKRAKAWLASAKSTQSQAAGLRTQNDSLLEKMKKMEEQIMILQQRVEAYEGKVPAGAYRNGSIINAL